MGILDTILIAGLTWLVLDLTVYSTKSRVKRLWKKIFKYASRIGEWKKGDVLVARHAIPPLENRIKKVGRLINAILDYEYQDSEDEDELTYAKENRWEEEKWKDEIFS